MIWITIWFKLDFIFPHQYGQLALVSEQLKNEDEDTTDFEQLERDLTELISLTEGNHFIYLTCAWRAYGIVRHPQMNLQLKRNKKHNYFSYSYYLVV